MKVKVRKGKKTDARRLSEIAIASKKYWQYPNSWFQLWGNTLEITPEFMAKNNVWVVTQEAELLGFVAISMKQLDAELEHMWVLPEYMNQGIGTMLMNQAIEFCRLNNMRALRIESDPNAKTFYEKLGAKHIGYIDSVPKPRKLPVLIIEL